jgi:hypothetical protein
MAEGYTKKGKKAKIATADYPMSDAKERKLQKALDRELHPKTGTGGQMPPTCYEIEPNSTADILMKMKILYDQPRVKNDEEIAERLNWYFFEYCYQYQMKPTIDGCCLALGIHRDTMNNWEHGESGSFKLDTAKKVKNLVKIFMEGATMEGKLNPIVWMFYGKNYFGMVDKQEMVLTPNRSEGDADVTAIQERLQSMQRQLPEGNE